MNDDVDRWSFNGEARPPVAPAEPFDPVRWFTEHVKKERGDATTVALSEEALRVASEIDPRSRGAALVRAHVKASGVPILQWDQVVASARARGCAERAGDGWESRLTYRQTKDGRELLSNAANVTSILRNDPDWVGTIARDVFRQEVIFRRSPPWGADEEGKPTPAGTAFQDSDITRIGSWLARSAYQLDVQSTTVEAAIAVVAEGNEFDSILDHLAGLSHDGTPRLDTWLTTYLGVRDTPFARFAGRAFLVSAIARAMDPGAKVDHILILEGEQDRGKSTALSVLFGDFFSETPIDLNSKDKFITIQNVWCQSFDELASLARSDIQTVNNYVTACFDHYRPVWAKRPVKVRRRVVFAGTVNPQNGIGYLKDPTGNRRFWPVLCAIAAPIDLDALRRDAPQLWAEAILAHRAGAKWWPSCDAERALCRAEQEERQQSSPLEEIIQGWLEGEAKDCRGCEGSGERHGDPCWSCKGTGAVAGVAQTEDFVTMPHVMAFLAIPRERVQGKHGEVAAALHRIGWLAGKRKVVSKSKITPYYRPGCDPDKRGAAADPAQAQEAALALAAQEEREFEEAERAALAAQ